MTQFTDLSDVEPLREADRASRDAIAALDGEAGHFVDVKGKHTNTHQRVNGF